jgi:hypothetical protein
MLGLRSRRPAVGPADGDVAGTASGDVAGTASGDVAGTASGDVAGGDVAGGFGEGRSAAARPVACTGALSDTG